ncbi:MAG: aminotransferase class V-fold PLP-dependent enzyme, partial [Desulfuromonadales bacterium]|nr:aminotransferase class V-fold PLP-dependent enzyme [Desulfuromonadales bacterium]
MYPIYLDYNATTPLDPLVVREINSVLETTFGNPSSGHLYGWLAKAVVELARDRVAALLGCAAAEIIFTSGG